ncbi:Metacaspase-1A [Coccomyxa sp. Obi]|nr:Metacaspase-1A [Coccomyxa sp. Obi]
MWGLPTQYPPPQYQPQGNYQGGYPGASAPYMPQQAMSGNPYGPPGVQTPAYPPGPGAAGGQPVAPPYQPPGAPAPAMPAPVPFHQQPAPAPSFTPGRKKALLCACNYRGSRAELRGCINDAHNLRYLLKTRFGFQDSNIVMLTDDSPNPQAWPTRANMMYQMQLLLWNAQPGDSLVFHFSGHGTQIRDRNGDEDDGLCETICPCDFKTAGYIVDDELNRLLVNPLPHGVRLHAIIDACHSGSALDLEFKCKVKDTGVTWKPEYTRRPACYKGTAGGEVLQIGASRDKQTAADTASLSGGISTGAATFAFIQAIERQGTSITYLQLLYSMTQALEQLQASHGKPRPPKLPAEIGGLFGGMVNKLVNGALDLAGLSGQTPVICSNYPFDLNRSIAL